VEWSPRSCLLEANRVGEPARVARQFGFVADAYRASTVGRPSEIMRVGPEADVMDGADHAPALSAN